MISMRKKRAYYRKRRDWNIHKKQFRQWVVKNRMCGGKKKRAVNFWKSFALYINRFMILYHMDVRWHSIRNRKSGLSG